MATSFLAKNPTFGSTEIFNHRIDRLKEAVLEISSEIDGLREQQDQTDINDASCNRSIAAERARWLLSRRQLRDRLFDKSLFADPAWDVLLDLFIAFHEGRKVAIGSACLAANVPFSSALRCCQSLENLGLIERHRDPHDGRRVLVQLTQTTVDKMIELLNREEAPRRRLPALSYPADSHSNPTALRAG